MIDYIRTLTDCERVIQELLSRDKSRAQFMREIETKNNEFEEEISRIQNLNLSQQICYKVRSIKNDADKKIQNIIIGEGYLFDTSRLSDALMRFPVNSATYQKANFISELKMAYANVCQLADNFYNRSARDISDNLITTAARSYAIIANIDQNIDRILDKYFDEFNEKRQSIAEIKNRQVAYQTSVKNKLSEDAEEVENLCNLVEDFIRRQKDALGQAELTVDTQMATKFATELTLHLGIMSDGKPESVVRLNAYSKTLTRPTGQFCYDVALYGGYGNMLITYDVGDKQNDDLYKILQSIIMKFILCYPSVFKNVAVIDHNPGEGSRLKNILNNLGKCAPEFFYAKNKDTVPIYSRDDEIREVLKQAYKTVRDRSYGSSSISDKVLAYNQDNPDNALPLTLLIIKDLDTFSEYDEKKVFEDLAFLLNNGAKNGVFVLFVGEKNSVKKYLADKIPLFRDTFEFNPYCKCLESDGKIISCCNGLENVNTEYFFSKLRRVVEDEKKSISSINFWNFQNSSACKDVIKNSDDFSLTLKIPIGKEGSLPVFLEMSSKDPSCHTVISGMTSTGKTVFLHNLILSTAYNYSPDQVEMWLFDLKQGAPEFSIYKDLKHVRFLSLYSEPQDISELLQYLNQVMKERGRTFGELSVNNISDYNAKVNFKERMRRILVIIDEYTELKNSSRIITQLEDIINKSRAYGISIILASQHTDSDFSKVYAQVTNRFVFLSGSVENDKTSLWGLIDAFPPQGTVLPGTCLYQRGQKIVTMRGTYINEYDKNEIKNKIAERDRNYPLSIHIVENPEVIHRTVQSPIQDICAYNRERISISVGQERLSGSPIIYDVDKNNTRVLLLGDGRRAQNLEYAFIRSFTSNPNGSSCYYIDASDGECICGYMRETIKSQNVNFVDDIKGIGDTISLLYAEYLNRLEFYRQKREVDCPIEVIIHCADELKFRLESCEPQEKSYSRMLQEMTSGASEHGKIKMHFTIHIENSDKMDDSLEFVFESQTRMNDAFVIPDNSGENMQGAYQNTFQFLQKIAGVSRSYEIGDFAEMYNKTVSGMEQEQKKLNYVILINESHPQKFLPYEYE